jgi:hypothetical protein
MTDAELRYICRAIQEISKNHETYSGDYLADYQNGTFRHREELVLEEQDILKEWFNQTTTPQTPAY